MVHDDGALLIVDLSVNPSLADQVHDPLLAVVLVQAQAGAEVLDVDAGVDLAVALGDEVAGGVDEEVGGGEEEEVGAQDLLGETELTLGLLEVEVDVEGANEVGDGVAVLVGLLLHDADDVLQLLLVLAGTPRTAATGDNAGGQVAENPGAVGLDGVDVGGAEEEVE